MVSTDFINERKETLKMVKTNTKLLFKQISKDIRNFLTKIGIFSKNKIIYVQVRIVI